MNTNRTPDTKARSIGGNIYTLHMPIPASTPREACAIARSFFGPIPIVARRVDNNTFVVSAL